MFANNNNAALELKKKGDVHLGAGRYDEAIAHYREALVISPKLPETLIALGFALYEKGLTDEAGQYLDEALSITPDDFDAHFMLGNIAAQKGNSQQAIDYYNNAIKLNPSFNFGYKALFEIHQQLGNLSRAKEVLERAMLALPLSTDFLFERAGLYFAEKDYQHTINLLKKALILSPNNVDYHINIANSYIQSEQHKAAIVHLEQAAKLRPDDAAIHHDLGNVYLKLDRKQEALVSFKEVVRIEPDSPLQHLVAAFSGLTTSTAPAGYIENLFDGYAENFESHLTQTLNYKTPTLLVSLIKSHSDRVSQKLDVLDLGCGTGLFGKAISPFAERIVGVDLSQKMLEKAAKLNIYARLEHKDILAMMRSEPDASYDLIAAADVFVYLGILDDIVIEAKRLLRPNGIFTFSTEFLAESKSPPEAQGFALMDTGRYAHAISYLNKLANDSEFNILDTQEEIIRENEGKPVLGHLSLWLVDAE